MLQLCTCPHLIKAAPPRSKQTRSSTHTKLRRCSPNTSGKNVEMKYTTGPRRMMGTKTTTSQQALKKREACCSKALQPMCTTPRFIRIPWDALTSTIAQSSSLGVLASSSGLREELKPSTRVSAAKSVWAGSGKTDTIISSLTSLHFFELPLDGNWMGRGMDPLNRSWLLPPNTELDGWKPLVPEITVTFSTISSNHPSADGLHLNHWDQNWGKLSDIRNFFHKLHNLDEKPCNWDLSKIRARFIISTAEEMKKPTLEIQT